MSNNFRVLFFGDIVGRPGRVALQNVLSKLDNTYDFIIANVENASHGFGLTAKNHEEILNYGVNCMTSGNHIWDKKEVFQYIDDSPALIRPYNYHKSAMGVGYRHFLDDSVLVINLLGKTFMNPIDCPFQAIENLSNELDFKNKIVIIDFHAEATAEKISFAKYASELGAKAVIGTHTHVQTADEKILNNKCAYITDAGFTGAYDSVIGMDYDSSIKRLITSIPERFDVAESPSLQVNAIDITFDMDLKLPVEIKRINYVYEQEKEGVS